MAIEARVSVDASDVLEGLSDRELLGELVQRDILTEIEAIGFANRGMAPAGPFVEIPGDDGSTAFEIDIEALGKAEDEIRRGNRAEALTLLERALGGLFVGRLA